MGSVSVVVEKMKGVKTVWKRGGGEDRVKVISFLSCREAVTFNAACSHKFTLRYALIITGRF
jgi:hypothetical protein